MRALSEKPHQAITFHHIGNILSASTQLQEIRKRLVMPTILAGDALEPSLTHSRKGYTERKIGKENLERRRASRLMRPGRQPERPEPV